MGYTLLLVLLGGLAGAGIGWFGVKQYNRFFSRRLERRALGVIEGNIKNQYELDGKKRNVNTFIFREGDVKENEIKIKLTKIKLTN